MIRMKGETPPQLPVESEVPMEPELPVEPELPMETGPSVEMGQVDPIIAVYRGPSLGPFQCGNCHFFEGEGRCVLVAGPIDEAGMCNLFTPASAMAEMEEPMPMEAPLPEDVPSGSEPA